MTVEPDAEISNSTEDQTEDLSEYRQWLIAAEQKSQEAFDKTILTLSGGALGISFVFLRDVIGTAPVNCPVLLLAAWVSWAFSSIAILISFYLSHLALRYAIKQIDLGKIRTESPGGAYSKGTAILNASGAILFFVGVCLITAFAHANLLPEGG